jgi:ribonuclease P protein component
VGLAVSKRVGNAVTRNLVKRRIRNAFAGMNTSVGWDVVVSAKPESADASFADLDRAIKKSVVRAGIEFTAPEPLDTEVVM